MIACTQLLQGACLRRAKSGRRNLTRCILGCMMAFCAHVPSACSRRKARPSCCVAAVCARKANETSLHRCRLCGNLLSTAATSMLCTGRARFSDGCNSGRATSLLHVLAGQRRPLCIAADCTAIFLRLQLILCCGQNQLQSGQSAAIVKCLLSC